MKTESRGNYDSLVFIIIFVILLMFMLAGAGCKTVAPVASSDTVRIVTVKEVVKDTTVYVDDYGGWSAWTECDSLGQVTLRQLEIEKGKWIEPKVLVRNNYIKSECVIDSGAVYVSWKERHTTDQQRIETVKVERVNYLTGWQWFQVWAARIAAVMLLLFAGVWVYRRRFPP